MIAFSLAVCKLPAEIRGLLDNCRPNTYRYSNEVNSSVLRQRSVNNLALTLMGPAKMYMLFATTYRRCLFRLMFGNYAICCLFFLGLYCRTKNRSNPATIIFIDLCFLYGIFVVLLSVSCNNTKEQNSVGRRRATMPTSSSSALKCCQSSASLNSIRLDVEQQPPQARRKSSLGLAPLLNVVKVPEVIAGAKPPLRRMDTYHFPKRQAVDLHFEDVTYTAWSWQMTKMKKEQKNILHGVSGTFKSGELSVIMGPSGAGKSTLLNILAGFTTRGSSGVVKLNETVRDQRPRFRKLSAYIPQDEELRLALTVKEAMTFAANLKLGYTVSADYKAKQVTEVLEMLGLEECHHTLTSRLSGGQRKRLGIALELLSNPPILFLDEPTTGLDSSSCTQCVSLMKRLAQEGRTIVCTIHQPSALLFEMFDKLYALSRGKCIYDGTAKGLVPHLSTMGLKCPPYHNPADYLMEVAMEEHHTDVDTLAAAVEATRPAVKCEKELTDKEKEGLCQDLFKGSKMDKNMSQNSNLDASPLPAAVLMQFLLLYKRNLLTSKRNYMYVVNRLLAHVLIGLLFGYLYKDVGASANTILANYVYLYGSLLLLVYTGKMSVTLSFPLEMKILTREHFNRWYKLTPYLLSVLLIEIPFQILCTWAYIMISYWLTGQPFTFRLYLFTLWCTLSTLCAQSMGYFIGATTPTKIAVFIGPVVACLFSVFGFCITYLDTPYLFRWMYYISYYRAGFQGLVYSLYGFQRHDLTCPEEQIYCHYQDPTKFLKEMDIVNVDLVSNVSLIVVIWCTMHAATYLALWLKLNKR